jgi:hypothetical protein
MTYYTMTGGAITASADYLFVPEALATDKEIVRGYDGRLYFAGEEPEPDAAYLAAQRKAEILARLAEIDAASIRSLRAIAQGEAVQADHTKLAALDSEAADLRAELAGLNQAG